MNTRNLSAVSMRTFEPARILDTRAVSLAASVPNTVARMSCFSRKASISDRSFSRAVIMGIVVLGPFQESNPPCYDLCAKVVYAQVLVNFQNQRLTVWIFPT